jgi:hypothetical protein
MIKPIRIYRHTNGIWRGEFERDGRRYWFSLRTRDCAHACVKWDRYVESVKRHNDKERDSDVRR